MTIREIAKAAGVSPAAVSLVFNNKPGVGKEKRRIIEELLRENGYEKRVVSKKRVHVLFVKYVRMGAVVEQNGDFIARVIDGIQQEARRLDFTMVMRNATAEEFPEVLEEAGAYAGVILLGTELDQENMRLLEKLPVPVVVVDNPAEGCFLDAVVMDNVEGACAAVNYLAQAGHRKIGFIQSKFPIANFRQRFYGYRKGLEECGLAYHPSLVLEVSPTLDGSYQDMAGLLAKGISLPTAYFADNDSMALGVMKALRQYNVRVPEDISVIGFDDLIYCAMSDPPLTTIRIEKERMGCLAVKRLFEKIGGEEESLKLLVRPRLIARESVAVLSEL